MMKMTMIAAALAMTCVSIPAIAVEKSEAVRVTPSLFMDVKQVVSDQPVVPHTAEYISKNRCQDEVRTMYFKDSEGVLKVMDYKANNQIGCTDGDGGTYGS